MSLFRDRSFRATAAGHFAVDLISSQRPLILATWSAPFGLSNALIGLISAASTLLGSTLQPAFGLLADRIGARWVATFGILWMAVSFGLAVLVPGRLALLLLVLTAIGSAAFHPAGTSEATERAKQHFVAKAAYAASLFFLFGQIGLAIGPAVGGVIVELQGVSGLIVLLVVAVPVGVYAEFESRAEAAAQPLYVMFCLVQATGEGLFRLLWLSHCDHGSTTTMIAFIPKYFSDLGYSPAAFGIFAATYMGGSAIGGVLGGWLADRTNRRVLVSRTMILAGIPLLLMAAFGGGAWGYLIVFLAGGLLGMSHSPIVVHAQAMVPAYAGAASGAVLGFTFASGAIGVLVSGLIADRYGFSVVFAVTAASVILGGLLATTARAWVTTPVATDPV